MPIGEAQAARWATEWKRYVKENSHRGKLGGISKAITELDGLYSQWLDKWSAEGGVMVDFMATMPTAGIRRLWYELGRLFTPADAVTLIALLPAYVDQHHAHYNARGVLAEPECLCGLVEELIRVKKNRK